MDPVLKREIIFDNYQNPYNRETVIDNKYIKVNSNNESCIDNINLYVLFDNNKIIDIKFDGEACAISTSSTSIMIKELIGKTIDEIKKMYQDYQLLIENGTENDSLGECLVYNEVYKQNNRKHCALLPWIAINKAINEYEHSAI